MSKSGGSYVKEVNSPAYHRTVTFLTTVCGRILTIYPRRLGSLFLFTARHPVALKSGLVSVAVVDRTV